VIKSLPKPTLENRGETARKHYSFECLFLAFDLNAPAADAQSHEHRSRIDPRQQQRPDPDVDYCRLELALRRLRAAGRRDQERRVRRPRRPREGVAPCVPEGAMRTCDLLLSEHDDDSPCDNPGHQEAITRRSVGAAPWSLLERQERLGDFRDYLLGEPVHCGATLELQGRQWSSDDYGDYVLALPSGILVRYELEWLPSGKRPVIFVDAGSYEFSRPIEVSWMRFRWPARHR
jgi:hypothetical protein